MKRINISIILICLILISSSALTYSQQTIKYTKVKKERKNSWSLGLNYGENGFGPYAGLFSNLGRTTDLVFNISISGVTDEREIERFDVFGNSIVVDKINRVFMMPLSVGIRQELFKDDIDGDFLPIFNIGIAPTLVFTNPYNESYFSAFKYTQTHFAFGGFAGFGVSFKQNKSMTMNVNFNYYYLPLVGGGVQSVQYNTINDVGGLQLSLGVIFLK
jgi:hypothetical protein